MSPVLRFAPSPNGRLHLGHAFSALLNAEVAERYEGVWLLRVEDIDPLRCRPDHEAAIYDDLAWLGLSWPEPVRRQSEHMPSYQRAADELRARGLLYPCTCTRGDIAREVAHREEADGRPWPRDPDNAPVYPGACRGRQAASLEEGHPRAWRLDMAAALASATELLAWSRFDPATGGRRSQPADPARWGDAVLVRKDTPTSYHLSVVLDDAAQGVTHVVRGRDLEAATDLHVLLQYLLGLASPLYHHHRLLTDEDGAKLSKSAGSRSLSDLRRAGVTACEIKQSLGFP